MGGVADQHGVRDRQRRRRRGVDRAPQVRGRAVGGLQEARHGPGDPAEQRGGEVHDAASRGARRHAVAAHVELQEADHVPGARRQQPERQPALRDQRLDEHVAEPGRQPRLARGHDDLEHPAASARGARVQRPGQRRARAVGAHDEVDAGDVQRRSVREPDRPDAPVGVVRAQRTRGLHQHVRDAPPVLDAGVRQLGAQRVDEPAARHAVHAVERVAALDPAALVLEDGAAQRAMVGQAAVGAERAQGGDAVAHEDHPVTGPCEQLGGRVALEHDDVLEAAPAQRERAGQPGDAAAEDADRHVTRSETHTRTEPRRGAPDTSFLRPRAKARRVKLGHALQRARRRPPSAATATCPSAPRGRSA